MKKLEQHFEQAALAAIPNTEPSDTADGFNPDNYKKHIEHLDISKEKADAYLAEWWKLLSMIVDLKIDVQTIPLFLNNQDKNSGLDSGKSLKQEKQPTKRGKEQ